MPDELSLAHEIAADAALRGTLLGWRRPKPDARDVPMARALQMLAAAPAPDDALADKTIRQAHDEGYFSSWAALRAFWQWERAYFARGPAPSPAPASRPAVLWHDPDQLDQQRTNHCVGFGCSQFLNCDPIEDHVDSAFAHDLYYRCKVIDGEPRGEQGSSVHSGAKALVQIGRITTYVWAASLDDIKRWVTAQGPVIVGTDWLQDMFSPGPDGRVTIAGPVEGGHCYLLVGYDPATDLFTFQNSWGAQWGRNGYFTAAAAKWGTLFDAQRGAEACATTELPLTALRAAAR